MIVQMTGGRMEMREGERGEKEEGGGSREQMKKEMWRVVEEGKRKMG